MDKIFMVVEDVDDIHNKVYLGTNMIKAFDTRVDAETFLKEYLQEGHGRIDRHEVVHDIVEVPFESRTIKAIDNILNKM